eukprot:gb/GECH01005913.1/.p1 GENE.gb/GECH01005913.1/~~gb/GECH01005913.1/.p1  ORF type:complete len:734 (+),score=105.98 gb/GECH01005913.1/:1-2202(+)
MAHVRPLRISKVRFPANKPSSPQSSMPFSPPSDDINKFYASPISANEEQFVDVGTAKDPSLCEIDENMDDLERTCLLLNRATGNQLDAAIENLPKLFQGYDGPAVKQVTEVLQERVWKYEKRTKIMLASSLEHSLHGLTSEQCFLVYPLVISTLEHSADPVIVNAWRSLSVALVQHLSAEVLEDKVFRLIREKGALYQPLEWRSLTCELLGSVIKNSSKQFVLNNCVKLTLDLCQDTETDVRRAICYQLPSLAVRLTQGKIEEQLIPELLELLNDEESSVSCAAVAAVSEILETNHLSEREIKRSLLPTLTSILRTPRQDMLPSLIDVFGPLVVHIGNFLVPDEDDDSFLHDVITFFSEACAHSDPRTRRNCAFNFPAVVQSVGANSFIQYLLTDYEVLCQDSHVETRKSLCAGIHEIAKMLKGKAPYLKTALSHLMKDKRMEVRMKLIINMGILLDNMGTISGLETWLTSFYNESKNSWRKVDLFLRSFYDISPHLSSSTLDSYFINHIMNQIIIGCLPVRNIAADLFVVVSRLLCNLPRQEQLFASLSQELIREGSSYWQRIALLKICSSAANHYSHRFVVNNLVGKALSLNKDPIPAVRKKLCDLLPTLKRIVQPPSADVSLIALLNETVVRLTLDKEVGEHAKKAQKAMNEVEIEMSREARFGMSANQRNDQKKEKEEQTWSNSPNPDIRLRRRDRAWSQHKRVKGERSHKPRKTSATTTTRSKHSRWT